MGDKRIKITNGFHSMLTLYTGGTFSHSYTVHCMICNEKRKQFGDINNGFDRKTVYVNLSEVHRKNLLVTMKEVLDKNDNMMHVKIAKNMVKQLEEVDNNG